MENKKRPLRPDDIAELLLKAEEHKEPIKLEVNYDGNGNFQVYVTKLRLEAFEAILA